MAQVLAPARPEPLSKDRLRVWIRLLRATRFLEAELRERLRVTFDMTLPRFDVLAALYRRREGMIMSELSSMLMVSNGNVTGIVDRLVSDGLVNRAKRRGDRRTSYVSLTRKGNDYFSNMARVHEQWVSELLEDFDHDDAVLLCDLLRNIRPSGSDQHE